MLDHFTHGEILWCVYPQYARGDEHGRLEPLSKSHSLNVKVMGGVNHFASINRGLPKPH